MGLFRISAAFLDKALVRILYVILNFLKFLKCCGASAERWLSRAANKSSSKPDQSSRLNWWRAVKNESKSAMFSFFNEIFDLIWQGTY